MDFIILVGLQASGKTTFREVTFPDYVLVSKDLMTRNRKNRTPKSVVQTLLIRETLEAGKSLVVDNTNPSIEERAELVVLARYYSARVIVYHFRSNVQQSMERNSQRTWKAFVPRVGILSTAQRFVDPTLAEGFDELYEVMWGPERTFIQARVQ